MIKYLMAIYESVSLKWNFSLKVASVLEEENIFLWLAANGCLRNYGKLEWFFSVSKYTEIRKSLIKFYKATKYIG